MSRDDDILDMIQRALAAEARIALLRHPIRLAMDHDDLILEGEVADIAAKKLALERAAAVPGPRGIVDRLRVSAAERMTDGQIRDLLRDALVSDNTFGTCTVRLRIKEHWEMAQSADPAVGTIDVDVADGVVTLTGDVPGLALKRLAGVLAWWVPGSRDVINGLGVSPPEADSDEAITDAVRMALEKDPFVNPDQIRVDCHDAVVTLQGLLPTQAESEMAEFDAWYVFGVSKVINEILVRA